MKEEWCIIPNLVDYEASSFGRIRSRDRVVWYSPSARIPNGYKRWMKGRVLKPAPMISGHLMVVPGRAEGSRPVHQLVCEAFHGPRPTGMEVIHKDENPANNREANLKWGTRSENMQRCWAAGNRVVHPNFIGARWR